MTQPDAPAATQDVQVDVQEVRATEFWADCYYPWKSNGWIHCTCGERFHSDRRTGADASSLHHDHVRTVHRATPAT